VAPVELYVLKVQLAVTESGVAEQGSSLLGWANNWNDRMMTEVKSNNSFIVCCFWLAFQIWYNRLMKSILQKYKLVQVRTKKSTRNSDAFLTDFDTIFYVIYLP
jgi:hypothetical protein